MNLFLLDWAVAVCAAAHVDRHVVKMILELAQLLSTAHHRLQPETARRWMGNENDGAVAMIYRATHVNHPCAVWVRAHVNNYRYTSELALALCGEYTHRYGRVHATEAKLHFLHDNVPPAVLFERCTADPNTELVGPHAVTEPAQAMPDECRRPGDAVAAYRAYYQSAHKAHLWSWKQRPAPSWFDAKLLASPPTRPAAADAAATTALSGSKRTSSAATTTTSPKRPKTKTTYQRPPRRAVQ